MRELQDRLGAQVQLPSTYYINFRRAEFEQQERAFEALARS